MSLVNHDMNKFLPHGELLRVVGEQSSISTNDIKEVLRKRGVFFGYSDKENTIPFLANILLSPSEFNELRECFNTREDNQKKSSSSLDWSSEEALFEAIPAINFKKYFDDVIRNYKLKGKPVFYKVDNNQDHIRLEFQIERWDRNKCWIEQKNEYKGAIDIVKEGSLVRVISTTTSPETKDLATYITKESISYFKERKTINKEAKLNKILFNEFTNLERFVFFWRLSKNCVSDFFDFKDTVDINFKADDRTTLPSDISWMQNKKTLIFKGDEIHDVYFIRNKDYYKHLVVWGMEVKFDFHYFNRDGVCNFYFGFPDYNSKQKINNKAEFEMNITSLIINGKIDTKSRNNLKQKLLDCMDKHKTSIHQNFREYLNKENINND